MRVLAITQIWPNSLEPLSSAFNLQQFEELARRCDLTVLAAIAHVPGLARAARASSAVWAPRQTPRPVLLDALPPRETIRGIETHYLRQLYVPKLGVPIAVPLYLASLLPHRALLDRADVILGTWAYPDGCAAVLAARALVKKRKPVVVKVHGSDLNVIAKRPSARAVMRRVLPLADAMVSVSNPLSDELVALGVPRDRIRLVANGVSTKVFAPRDRGEARRALGVPEGVPLVAFVGRLEPQKGVGELLDAFDRVRAVMPDAMLVLLGDGVSKEQVAAAVARSEGKTLAPGGRPLPEIARWLTACDVFTLPSWMEGTPNVVLEALASGRPVVATKVGGIPDVLGDPRSGILVEPRDAASLASGLLRALAEAKAGAWSPETVRACGPKSWAESAASLLDVLEEARRHPGLAPI